MNALDEYMAVEHVTRDASHSQLGIIACTSDCVAEMFYQIS